MTQKFFVDAEGNYLGSFDGPDDEPYWDGSAWVALPAGITEVDTPPPAPGETWSGSAWTDTTASLALKAQKTYAGLIAGGIAITSLSAPSLNATYAVDQSAEINITGLQTSILTPGVAWLGWYSDIAQRKIVMTEAQFTSVAQAVLAFVAAADEALATAMGGGSPSWPAPTAAIP